MSPLGARTAILLPQLVAGTRGGLVGGYVNSVVNLLEELRRLREVVLFAGIRGDHTAAAEALHERLPDVELVPIGMSSEPTSSRYFVEFATRSPYAVRRAQATTVYGHSGHAAYAAVTAAAARVSGGLAVHALYCPITPEFQHRRVGTIARVVSRRGLSSVSSMVAISRNVAMSVAPFMPAGARVELIPPAIATQLRAQERPRRGAPGIVRLGFVGHHHPEKGFDLALAALGDVRKQHGVELLALMSGGESRRAWPEIAQMVSEQGVQDIVEVIPGIEDMRDFYDAIDLLLIPFRNTRGPSDYPLVLLEALALGVPAVCVGVGAIPDVIKHGRDGFLARGATREDFAAAIRTAIAALRDQPELSDRVHAAAEPFYAASVATATHEHLSRVEAGQV